MVRLFLFFSFFSMTLPLQANVLSKCSLSGGDYDEECLIEVPGSQCADGTPSYMTLVRRQSAKHLLVYLKGGGACWSGKSCRDGLARPLTRIVSPTEWKSGTGIHDKSSPSNPFATDFNILTIPYCTGDVFTGDNVATYTDVTPHRTIRHVGYRNVLLSLELAQQFVGTPEKAVLLGASAGGIGAIYHLKNLRRFYPHSRHYVVSDSGVPFKPPHIHSPAYGQVLANWGTPKHFEEFSRDQQPDNGRKDSIEDFGQLVKANTEMYPDTRFGFIASYRDAIMTFFGIALGTPSGMRVVKENIIDIANNYIGAIPPHARVFYMDASTHVLTPRDLSAQISMGVTLAHWMTDMLSDQEWKNVRPDLSRQVQSAEEDRFFRLPTQFPQYP